MTLYLTEATDPDDVAAAAADGLVTAVKLYPAGATTNSASGVRDLDRAMPVLERMAAILQGVYKRATEGLASSDNALQTGRNVKALADLGWQYAQRS